MQSLELNYDFTSCGYSPDGKYSWIKGELTLVTDEGQRQQEWVCVTLV